jgi:hypothetical protein
LKLPNSFPYSWEASNIISLSRSILYLSSLI